MCHHAEFKLHQVQRQSTHFRASFRWAIIRALGLIAVCAVTGCSTASGLRSRWFGSRETAVAPAEIGTSAPRLDQSASPQRRRGRLPSRGTIGALERTPATWVSVGQSVDGRAIEAMMVGSGRSRVLLIGGIHGDEPEGLVITERLAQEIALDPSATRHATIVIIRDLNPDGTAEGTRANRNGVDLNRNFPASNWDATARQPRFQPGPQPASEPETRVLVELIREFQPHRILVMHSTRGQPMVNYDGPASELAEAMSRLNGYAATDSIGYPTPGSLGSYAGVDLQIPIITLELPRRIETEAAWLANRAALIEFVRR